MLRIEKKPVFLQQTETFYGELYDTIASLPAVRLEDFQPEQTALFLVDLVNGFAVEGAMASPRVGALAAPAAQLAARCHQRGIPVVAFADAHTPASLELASYPPHCLRGTAETELCPEIAAAAPLIRIEKNSTNGFVEPAFDKWLADNAAVDTYIVVGDCTDICIQQFVLTAKAWHNARNRPLRILIPVELVDTFDAPGHPADVLGAAALYFMQAAGAQLCAEIQ